jgi:ribosome-associated protein
LTSEEKAQRITEIADEAKAERIETLNVNGKTIVADYFVVCSGNSDVHVRAIADRIADRMREGKMRAMSIEGESTGWVLIDFGDVVCHVMREEQRQFYDLESLWESMPLRPDIEVP